MNKVLAAMVIGLALTACGQQPVMTMPARSPLPGGNVQAQSVAGMTKAVRFIIESTFKTMDTNRDGFISVQENLELDEAEFRTADSDRDHRISLKEFLAFRLASPYLEHFFGMARTMATENLADFDANHDRVLDAKEFRQGFPASEHPAAPKIFQFADENRDNRLDASEMEDAMVWLIASGSFELPAKP